MAQTTTNAPALTVSCAPHIAHADHSQQIMLDVALALVPTLCWGTYLFGIRALILCAIAVLSAIGCEWIFETLLHRPVTVGDGSALVTGLLVGLNIPVAVPLWIPAVGSAFAILIVKQLFGGLGKNFVNPAMAGRVFLALSFPVMMSTFTAQQVRLGLLPFGSPAVDGIASATPLAEIAAGGTELLTGGWNGARKLLMIGFHSGCIGEVGTVALLLGGLYLIFRKVISWHIPAAYLGTVAVLALLFPGSGADPLVFAVVQLCSGGLLLGAFFMATDYVTSPLTPRGKVIFGMGCGILTVLFRSFGAYTEGVSFAVLIMNLLTPYIDRLCRHRAYGLVTEQEGKA